MSNLLELNFTENNDIKLAANKLDNILLRKEYYIKSLVVDALAQKSAGIDTSNSLMKSIEFYKLTGIFDFYVNNNSFDLILLKPDSDELVFSIEQSEVRTNLYGYVVVRLGSDVKNVEILGYFLSKNLEKAVFNGVYTGFELKNISDFEDIEILDSQMSLTDVSDRFFELVSMFMDTDLHDENLSEFVCLLVNSSELRDVFAQFIKFDGICNDLSQHKEYIIDEFLSVFSSNEGAEVLEEEDESDSSDVDVNDFVSEETLVTMSMPDEPVTDEVSEDLELDVFGMEDLPELDAFDEDEDECSVDEVAVQLSDSVNVIEETAVDVSEETSDIVDSDESEFDDLFAISEEVPSSDSDLEELTLVFDEDLDSNEEVGASGSTFDINLDDFVVGSETEVVGAGIEEDSDFLQFQVLDESVSSVKADCDALLTENIEQNLDTQLPSDVFSTQNINIDNDLMGILSKVSDDEPVFVSEEEVLRILGVIPAAAQNETTSADDSDVVHNDDLTLLYNEEQVAESSVAIPAEAIVSKPKQSGGKLSSKNMLVLLFVVVLLAGIGATVAKFAGKDNASSDEYVAPTPSNMPDSLPTFNTDMGAKDIELPPVGAPKKELSMPVSQEETKIVSSLTNEIKAGAAPVMLKGVAWQVPSSISNDAVFSKYLQIAGKNIKMNLASDLLNTSDFAYNNKIKVSLTVRNNAPVRNVKIIESSGSQNVDDIVLQSIKQTLKYVNSPVMSADKGDKDVVLVISI